MCMDGAVIGFERFKGNSWHYPSYCTSIFLQLTDDFSFFFREDGEWNSIRDAVPVLVNGQHYDERAEGFVSIGCKDESKEHWEGSSKDVFSLWIAPPRCSNSGFCGGLLFMDDGVSIHDFIWLYRSIVPGIYGCPNSFYNIQDEASYTSFCAKFTKIGYHIHLEVFFMWFGKGTSSSSFWKCWNQQWNTIGPFGQMLSSKCQKEKTILRGMRRLPGVDRCRIHCSRSLLLSFCTWRSASSLRVSSSSYNLAYCPRHASMGQQYLQIQWPAD